MRLDLQAQVANSADRFIGTLWGAAIGDALGWPYEARANPLASDASRVEARGTDLAFLSWTKQSGGRFRPYQEAIERGEYSDDTQLIIAVARARLTNAAWWARLAEVEFPFWTMYERGGGGATLRATKQLLKGELPWEARGSAAVSKYFGAGGNGVAMRVAPHCLAHAESTEFDGLARDILSDGVLTHGHPRALVGALAYGFCLWWALQNSETLRYGELIKASLRGEEYWSRLPDIHDRWPTWAQAANRADIREHWKLAVAELRQALRTADEAVGAGALAIDRETLAALGCFDRRVNGAGTVSAAAAIFLASRHAASPIEGVVRAAKAKGADTDTLASMTGALLGAVAGIEWLMPHVNSLQDHSYIRELAERLLRGTAEDRPHRPFRARDANHMLGGLRDGRTDFESQVDGITQVVPYEGIRTQSSKLEVRAWKARLQGQTIFIKDVRERKDSSPLPVPQAENLGTFSGVAIGVADLATACHFYERILGLQVTRRTDKFISLGQLALRAVPGEPSGNGTATLFVEVGDLQRCRQVLQDHGLSHSDILRRSGRDTLICRDPDGNLIEIIQRS
ncbi:MAG: ADP-ribosylglycohydrolase family protein [Phenylobacterium sp.]|uniref:ADP-ribosylglycohydrolase family protein n=1 Tax=Phenylobacterium sp. TaxID=1871053 RepID=UPI001A211995|nr:ADP-ribosylglycohydrolase family protein [Phenylobacterium sp.]MBJ7411838.1 ADP-ribosylglycohydrolase family protein [Phenylobacterium sp.]